MTSVSELLSGCGARSAFVRHLHADLAGELFDRIDEGKSLYSMRKADRAAMHVAAEAQ